MFQRFINIRAYNSDVRRILIMWAFNHFAFFGVVTVLLNLYLLRLGFDVEFIGFFNAAGQAVWALASLPVSMLARRIGLRTGLTLACTLAGTGTALVLVVEWLPAHLWGPWLIGSWMVLWLGAALLMVSSVPYLMLAAGPELRNQVFATNAAVQALAAFAGSAIAGLLPGLLVGVLGVTLDDPAPYRLALWLAPVAWALASYTIWGAQPLHLAVDTSKEALAGAPIAALAVLGCLVFLIALGNGAARAFFNVFAELNLGVRPSQIGLIIGVGQLLPVAMIAVTPLILQRYGTGGAIALVGVCSALGLVFMGVAPHWVVAATGLASYTSA